MSQSVGSALYGLPVETRPGYSAKVALSKLAASAEKAERTLSPSFWRSLLGGTSKDHSRAVIAILLNDTKAIRDTLLLIRQTAADKSIGDIHGISTRVVDAIDSWRKAALEYENATYGSDETLRHHSQKMRTLSEGLLKESKLFGE